MQVDGSTLITLGGAVLGVIVWLLRLEGRVKTLEAMMGRAVRDLEYIRDRIDTALRGTNILP